MAKSALHTSAGLDLVDDLRREIVDGLDINEADEAGLTPLHHACIHWSYESAKILLEAGADVDPRDQWGNTPLLRVVGSRDDSLAWVTLLLEYGANPTIENNYGHSPLSNAKRMQGTERLLPALEEAQKRFTAQ
ncbi:ankyrin repeat domain-containing protein [Mycolicibacterium smegmatis]|uniref:ankyrin repeat domain-containing protein n=1 Tax=Mycolicibacterium smegmatis TaxID=1772 RepID=UPI00071AF547|nr:ankyrin repeat domain-containing protein [Mycolicibacterium smegmatis]MDF1910302.1 ankyrin repeat domain-containing protein [Mycolicibacterium smegmatis]MDF1928626.1 ankyrin repeat domain-containing protein [Mycolicibacterium smegmatis]UGT73249.1 ankyrin repeat domain-containing protein [Mycolicibacterium smegmatis]ULN35161.1 ankyrin repeat domain-containing protein [Mycolicibacterium smegmatis]